MAKKLTAAQLDLIDALAKDWPEYRLARQSASDIWTLWCRFDFTYEYVRRVTRQAADLLDRGLIQRAGQSNRYVLTPAGRETIAPQPQKEST